MILIRGIRGEAYARRIEKGIVDCRDILSALLVPPKTGYAFSDYYEKNLVKALSYHSPLESTDLHDPDFLYSLLIDFYVPHIYLTYFHILNERSLDWLENFEDDYHFIAVDVQLDRITKTAIGNEYFGTKIQYVNSISELSQSGLHPFRVACMCSLDHLFADKREMAASVAIYNTLAFALLCREQEGKFTDIENEFRIIAYDCPKIIQRSMQQIPRETTITGASGLKYRGVLNAGTDSLFQSNRFPLRDPTIFLRDLLNAENGMVTLESKFKPISVDAISKDYRYLGDKKACAKYIKKMLKLAPHDEYVDRTVRRQYKISDLGNVTYAPSLLEVDYNK